MTPNQTQPATIPLAQLNAGQTGTLNANALDPQDADLLRSMGLRPDCMLRVCRKGQPCIVQLCDHCNTGPRIALAADFAKRLRVTTQHH